MTTSCYRIDEDQKQRLKKRIIVVLAAVNPNRDAAIWCGVLRDMLQHTARGRVYRAKLWNRSSGSEPITVIDAVCRDLLTELEQHEQLPLFSAALLQELAGSK